MSLAPMVVTSVNLAFVKHSKLPFHIVNTLDNDEKVYTHNLLEEIGVHNFFIFSQLQTGCQAEIEANSTSPKAKGDQRKKTPCFLE